VSYPPPDPGWFLLWAAPEASEVVEIDREVDLQLNLTSKLNHLACHRMCCGGVGSLIN
jgi:hypothetical protein